MHQSFVKLAEHMATIPDGPCPRTRNLVVTVAERKAIDLYRSRQRHPETELDEQTVWSAPPEGGGLADAMAAGVKVTFGSRDAVEAAGSLFDRVETL